MYRIKEYTNLIKARVFYDGKGAYTFNLDKGIKAPNPYVFRGDHDQFVRFLMGIRAKDNKTWPRSVRGEKYADIASEIESGEDQIIYVWEHDFMRYINSRREAMTPGEFLIKCTNLCDEIGSYANDKTLSRNKGKGDVHIYRVIGGNASILVNPSQCKIAFKGYVKEETGEAVSEDFISMARVSFTPGVNRSKIISRFKIDSDYVVPKSHYDLFHRGQNPTVTEGKHMQEGITFSNIETLIADNMDVKHYSASRRGLEILGKGGEMTITERDIFLASDDGLLHMNIEIQKLEGVEVRLNSITFYVRGGGITLSL